MKRWGNVLAAVLGIILTGNTSAAPLPEWLQEARAIPSPSPTTDLHAHVLLQETRVTLSERGRERTRERGAIRILDARGAPEAVASIPYDRTSAKVLAVQGWWIDATGKVKSLGRNDAVDAQLEDAGTFRTDLRRVTLFVPEAGAGSVFAWEFEVEEEALFADRRWWLGSSLPCAVERIVVELPAKVAPNAVTLGSAGLEAVRDGNVWRWERRDVPAVPREPWSAAAALWRDGLLLGPRAPDGSPGIAGAAFSTWAQASRWLYTISEPSLATPPELMARAHTLAGPGATPLAQAQALARHVQSLNYLSIVVGLAHGEGYRPQPATDVLRLGYGDCKDKAALLCALARSLGMEAWLASASTEGRDAVRHDWPSPTQFNHCIAALRVPEGTALDAVATSELGPLLFFDPTDTSAPFGTLPSVLAGSSVLLIHPERGGILRLPVPATTAPLTESSLEGAVDDAGRLEGRWTLVARGRDAQLQRNLHARPPAEWRSALERELVEWLGSCQLSEVVATDLPDSDAFRISAKLAVPRYGRPIGARLVALPVSPRVASRTWQKPGASRRAPIALPLLERSERVTLTLPPGWSIRERPSTVARTVDFGRLASEWDSAAAGVRLRFRARVEPVTLPRSRYDEWTAWLADWNRATRAQVVVERP